MFSFVYLLHFIACICVHCRVYFINFARISYSIVHLLQWQLLVHLYVSLSGHIAYVKLFYVAIIIIVIIISLLSD